ncbi:unnamed protein product (macronuclear) [Paramecium tetraurelia]|uniref:Uncharacterized protein n=1 Tax=Paramecium tetraurelia TaxID=5888 RepID=A0E3B6_PARTE|nr:uncharacterized protein GSPATT00022956001 [Paramecium tetraurelia]CAK89783.1 unnamed protein product [Paramecium tetraurelia]|eukprot:XP_001457180.1 hypothetical protein (macronuclear) [Paramecium tetraurelia strain d4-2]
MFNNSTSFFANSNEKNNQLKEKIYSALYQSPNTSYDVMKWIPSNDISNLSVSIEQDIDKILQVIPPCQFQPNKQISFQNCYTQQSAHCQPMTILSSSQKNNSENIYEPEIKPIQQPQIESNSKHNRIEQQQILSKQNQYIQDLITRYKEPPKNAFQEDQNHPTGNIEEEQDINTKQSVTNRDSKQKGCLIIQEKCKNNELSKLTEQQTCLNQSIGNSVILDALINEENIKQVQSIVEIESQAFNTNQNWAKMKLRKEAKQYEIYKTQNFLDLLYSLPSFFIHQIEGELKVDKLRAQENQEGYYYQSFELTVNPFKMIGPINFKKNLKIHIRFKKGYYGVVYYDKQLQNVIPQNQVDGITLKNEPFLLANNSDKPIKVICCIVGIKK